MLIVIARFRPRPDQLDEFVTLLREVQAASRRDEGCLHYGYYSEVGDPLEHVAIEYWRDEQALTDHLRTPHVRRLVAALPEHADARPHIEVHTVAATGPLVLPN